MVWGRTTTSARHATFQRRTSARHATFQRLSRGAFALVAAAGCTEPSPADEGAPASPDAGFRRATHHVEELSNREAVRSGSALCRPEPERCSGYGAERPRRLSEHTAAYDPMSRSMFVFGGTSSVPVDCAPAEVEFSDALWVYDDPCGRWRELAGRGPSPRARHMATFGAGRLWVFGGRFRAGTSGYYELYYDLWAFDPESGEWTELENERGPTARTNGVLVFDERRQRLWLMGGNQGEHKPAYVPTNDVWSYSLEDAVWSRHNTSVGPSPRFFHAATVDTARDRLVVFGGADATTIGEGQGYFGDLWALDLETLRWDELAPSGSGPDGRFSSQLVYDSDADAYLLFAGHDDQVLGNRNDAWRFDPDDGQWRGSEQEDVAAAGPGDGCTLPADFATVAFELPERRHSHTLVWSPVCRHALLFAGKTDCGASDDVWRWSNDGWNVRVPAREGEACPRWADDPARCRTLCE